MRTASGIYDSIACTDEAAAGDRAFLEWTATALGLRIDGVTVLRMDDHGQFTAVSIHHRPLAAVLAFSAEMGRRLARSLPYARSTASWAASRTGERPGSEIR